MGSKKLLSAKDFSGDDVQVGMIFYLGKKDKIKKSEGLEVVTSDVCLVGGKLKFKNGDIVKVVKNQKVKFDCGKKEFNEVTFVVEREGELLTDEKGEAIQYVFNANLFIHHLFPVSDLSQVIMMVKEEVSDQVHGTLQQ